MYKIKQKPEDFAVKELFQFEPKSTGKYSYFWVKKKNYTTLQMVSKVAGFLKTPMRAVGFAGTKDKFAITEQAISVKGDVKARLEHFKHREIEIKFLGYADEPVCLGAHQGNEFIITIRELDKRVFGRFVRKYVKRNQIKFVNYFGKQRFSVNTHVIGREIVRKNYKEAVELIAESNVDYCDKIKQFLNKHKSDYVGALKLLPRRLLMLYVHAYQSQLWNETVEKYLAVRKRSIKIPLIGFGTEIRDKLLKQIIEKDIMVREKLRYRDFINRGISFLSVEGIERDVFVYAKHFGILEKEDDELFEGKKKIKIAFSLPKSTYATELIRQLFL